MLAPVALLATVLGGALAVSTYQWPTDPFSVVGATGGSAALAFNAGLALAGVLAAVHGGYRWATGRRGTGAVYALGGIALAVAGLFPAGSDLHAAAAVFLFTAWLPPVADGVARWRRGERAAGVAGVALGAAAFGVWLPLDLGLAWAWVGYGAAELVSFAAWGAWTAWVAGAAPEIEAGKPEVRGA